MIKERELTIRRDLADDLLREAYGDSPTLIGHAVAASFAQRFVEASTRRQFLGLVTWTERTCERYAELPQVGAMLNDACLKGRTVLRLHRLSTSALEDDMLALEASMRAALARVAAKPKRNENALGDDIDATIAAFFMQIEASDGTTAEHSRAVSLWCRRLAKRLGLPQDECTYVARGGLLHDVGKTSVPSEILIAPRSLTDAEFDLMREHASRGAAMIGEVAQLRDFLPLVRNHHERLDGRGYPDRLAGSEIPIHVRIVTVADCFNAMIGRRPYRSPMSPAVALEQLMKNRGTQFDHLVVEAMVDIIERPDAEIAKAR